EALPHLASEGRGVRRKERVQLRAERGGAPDPGDGAPLRPRPPATGSPRPRARPRRAGRAGGRVCGARPRRGRRSRRRGRPGARRLREVPRPRGAGGRGPGGGRRARRRRPGASDARRGRTRGAHQYAMRYATERTAFGRPIAHHQALAFLIADLATAVDVARLAVWRAAAALDRGERAEWEAASALAEAAEQALFVGPNAVQI